MKVKNKKNKANYLNYKDGGATKKVIIPAGKVVEVIGITKANIINFGDFQRGFFEILVEEVNESKETVTEASNKKPEDTFDKVEKEVKNYTDNKKKNKN